MTSGSASRQRKGAESPDPPAMPNVEAHRQDAQPDWHEDVTHWQRFSVPYAFPVSFTRDVFADDNPVFRQTLSHIESDKRHRLIVFIDAGLAAVDPLLANRVSRYCQTHADVLILVCEPVIAAGGETAKDNWESLRTLQNAVADHAIDRHSYVVAIGGGALLDAVGLVAATAHRGIRHIRIPSTVLAQNDSGVGVKNAVNEYQQKNYLGTFAPPFAVINDSALLDLLPAREQRAGMAEAVKVALIRDAAFFDWLEAQADALAACDPQARDYLIRRCAQLHMRQIGQGGDPFELGSARPLDFGHWAAHRLETLSGHSLRHGEAVAIGIALDTRYSVITGHLNAGAEQRVVNVLERLGFALWHPLLRDAQQGSAPLIEGLAHFREHLGGELTITLLKEIGVGFEIHQMNTADVVAAIDWLERRQCKDG